MLANESERPPLSQEQLRRSFMDRSVGTAHHLEGINNVHGQLDPQNAILSPEEAVVLKQAEVIVKKVRDALLSTTSNVQMAPSQGIGLEGGR
ncbi:hypothetical protein HY463_00960 [Candidatus Peregrinibacteria bacterium]|nr:hypothetical protein [Candidatus Peregrinibacteria bacterium]